MTLHPEPNSAERLHIFAPATSIYAALSLGEMPLAFVTTLFLWAAA